MFILQKGYSLSMEANKMSARTVGKSDMKDVKFFVFRDRAYMNQAGLKQMVAEGAPYLRTVMKAHSYVEATDDPSLHMQEKKSKYQNGKKKIWFYRGAARDYW